MDNQIEYRIDFTDVTLNETDGIFKDVQEIMLEEHPYNDKWALRSSATITSMGGVAGMELQFQGDGGLYILEYKPSIKDVFYNPDLQVLSLWAQKSGWKVPQPHFDLVKENKEFWKHFYDTLIIDSDFFDELYGKRPQAEFLEQKDAKNKKSKKGNRSKK